MDPAPTAERLAEMRARRSVMPELLTMWLPPRSIITRAIEQPLADLEIVANLEHGPRDVAALGSVVERLRATGLERAPEGGLVLLADADSVIACWEPADMPPRSMYLMDRQFYV